MLSRHSGASSDTHATMDTLLRRMPLFAVRYRDVYYPHWCIHDKQYIFCMNVLILTHRLLFSDFNIKVKNSK